MSPRSASIAVAAILVVLVTAAARANSAATQGPLSFSKIEARLRAGEILVEWYFDGPDEKRGEPLGTVKFASDTLHDVRSVTKSIVSLLFGIALGKGVFETMEAPVLHFFPEYPDLQTEERRRIRLGHLLSMKSGLHWGEDTYPYTDARNSETAMDLAPDRFRHILSQPFDAPPGQNWRYSGGDVALIAEVIARATKTPLEEFARKELFEPLGIASFEWLKDERGIPYAASGLRLLPRDMMKIGLMMLREGRAGERQIVPSEWVRESVKPHALVVAGPGCGTSYGYFWWLGPSCPAEPGRPGWYGGIGNGGQRIMIFPERQLVIVITAGLYDDQRQGLTRGLIQELVATAAPSAAQR